MQLLLPLLLHSWGLVVFFFSTLGTVCSALSALVGDAVPDVGELCAPALFGTCVDFVILMPQIHICWSLMLLTVSMYVPRYVAVANISNKYLGTLSSVLEGLFLFPSY